MRNRWKEMLSAAVALTLLPVGCALGQKGSLSEKEDIVRSFKLASPDHRQLVVDNIDGEIEVTGYDGETIELVAHRQFRGENEEKLAEAKREIRLDIKEEKNKLILYVDAPWRTGDRGINYKGWHYYGYDARFDFELKVPKRIGIFLSTVNHGTVMVNNIVGDCEVRNVNGGIEMEGIDGAASVRTVNGPVKVGFVKNPGADCSFKTVNGKIEVRLQDGLNCDMRLKTFNGHVYTDYDFTSVPGTERTKEERRGMRTVFRRNESYSARIGKGGPEFSFDTLNGNIYVLKEGER